MLKFTEITIHERDLFEKYLRAYQPQISELTFTNLFMWRNHYKLRYTEINGFLCIISVPNKNEPFSFIPMGEFKQEAFNDTVLRLKNYFLEKGWQLKFNRLTDAEINYFKFFVNSDKDIILERDSSDYIYFSKDLINLAGKKYDGKRNHISKFKRQYEFEYIKLSAEYITECQMIMNKWCSERSCDEHKELYCEKQANMEILNNFEELHCRGALIKVNGKFEAFTIGEMLNTDTAVIHIEKASSKVNGLYTFINQQFCENEWQDVVYVNREQDLGIEGLRKAKLSYHPAKMINKYTLNII